MGRISALEMTAVLPLARSLDCLQGVPLTGPCGEPKIEANKKRILLHVASMSFETALLRVQVESSLASRVASPFQFRDRLIVETVPTGVPPIDQLVGGFPRGSLTEIYGPPCSGRTSLLVSALASRTTASEVCALVDARDAFDPHSAEAAGVNLQQLLWVRCRNVDQALHVTDLLIQGGGFGLIALDLGDTPPHVVRYIPMQVWFRLRRAVEHTPTIFLVVEQESNIKTCASLILGLHTQETRWTATAGSTDDTSRLHSPGCLLDGWKVRAEILRSQAKREDRNSILFETKRNFRSDKT
jgi:recombination protein RecA